MPSKAQPKILIIASEFPPDTGGIGNHAFNLAVHLAENNFPVTVLADIIHATQQDVENAPWFKKINFFPVYRNKIIFFSYYLRIQKAIELARHNEVVILSGKYPVWMTALLKYFFSAKKFIAVVHGSELRLPLKWQRRLIDSSLSKCNSLVAVSNFTKSLLAPSVLKNVNCFVIPNGINADEFHATRPIKKIEHKQKNLQLITVGSVTERKGQENVIQALPEVLKKFPGSCYHMVGKPLLQNKLSAIIGSKKINEHIIFHGAVERKKMLELLSGADLKFMLSNQTATGDAEGFGIAVLEANALGIPAIGSKKTGLEDAIKNNDTGILVDPKNVSEIVSAVEKILNDYERFSAMAKQWALQHDWKIIVKKYIDVIERVF